MAASGAREPGASEPPGQSRANGTSRFFLCSLLLPKKKKKCICVVFFCKGIKEDI